MLYTKHNIGDLDLSKYQRFVTLGCSFTRWNWPTWADLLAREMPDAKFINVGKGGAGNPYIVTMLNYLSRRYNFGPETLVGVMWSTFCREDNFVYENPRAMEAINKPRGWVNKGNLLHSQQNHPFIKIENIEPVHYLLRDTALISSANAFMRSADFDTINISALDLRNQIPHGTGQLSVWNDPGDELIDGIMKVYEDLDDDLVGYIQRWGEPWFEQHVYPTETDPEFLDYHPRCIDYANLLVKWGIPISPDTLAFASDFTQMIDSITDPEWRGKPEYGSYVGHPDFEDERNLFENLF